MIPTQHIHKRKHYYREQGYWGDATLLDYWRMAVLSCPDKTAVVDRQGSRYTYAQLDHTAGKVCSYIIDQGIKSGDFVSIQLPGWVEFTIIYIACLKAGAIVNPICLSYCNSDIVHILNKCESKLLFIPAEFKSCLWGKKYSQLHPQIPSLAKIVQIDKLNSSDSGWNLEELVADYPVSDGTVQRKADDLAAVLFTSGTEGFPKGVMLTHNNIIAAEKSLAAKVNFSSFDVLLMPAPVGHATGFHHGVTLPFIFAATSVLQDVFRPEESLQLIEQESCTCGMGATPFVYDMFEVLSKKDYNISSLRFFLCGGASVPRSLMENAQQAGFRILGVYGSTESVPHAACCCLDPADKIITTDGCVVPGVEVKVIDHNGQSASEGEELSRGPNVFVGYLKEPELTAKALDHEGWYYSGDLCAIDTEGYLRITGRKKDMIVRGGENISSREIEEILLRHPNIREAAAVAMPDPRLGEKVCAFLVLHNEQEQPDLKEILDFFVARDVPKYKCPERLEFLNQLPRTESGKIQKYVLRDIIRAKLANDTLLTA